MCVCARVRVLCLCITYLRVVARYSCYFCCSTFSIVQIIVHTSSGSLNTTVINSVAHCHCSRVLVLFSPSEFPYLYRLVGLVVKASASSEEDPGFESRLRRDFFWVESHQCLNIGTPVATLPGAWHYRVSAGIGWPGVSIL